MENLSNFSGVAAPQLHFDSDSSSDFTVNLPSFEDSTRQYSQDETDLSVSVRDIYDRYQQRDEDYIETSSEITDVDQTETDNAFRNSEDAIFNLSDFSDVEQEDYMRLCDYMAQSSKVVISGDMGLSRLFKEPWTFYIPICDNPWGHKECFKGCQSQWCSWLRDSYELKARPFLNFLEEYQHFLDTEPLFFDDFYKTPAQVHALIQNPDYHEQFATMNYRIITRGWFNNLQNFFCIIKAARLASERVRNMVMFSEMNKRTLESVIHHPYAKGLRPLDDSHIMLCLLPLANAVQRKQFFSDLYMIRQLMDDPTDYGLKEWAERNVAEGNVLRTYASSILERISEALEPNDITVESVREEVVQREISTQTQTQREEQASQTLEEPIGWGPRGNMSFVDYAIYKIHKTFTTPRSRYVGWDIQDWLEDKLGKVFDMFVEMLVIVKDYLMAPLNAIKDVIMKMLTSSLKGALADLVESIALKKILIGSLVAVVAVSLVVSGIISKGMADGIVKGLSGISEKISGQVAESGEEVIPFFNLLCVGFFDMDVKQYFKLEKVLKNMLILLSGGAIIANTYGTILSMMPHALRMALIFKFGTKEQRLKVEIDEWRLLAQSLCSVSKQQKVAVSKVFTQKVKELMKTGNVLIRDIRTEAPQLMSQNFMQTYNGLFKIYTNINLREYNSGGRPVPFAFHLSGDPGIGKSKVMPLLIRDSFGYLKEDTYERPVGQEYESGYTDQPVYVIDEFLLDADADMRGRIIHSFLNLVSSLDYRPNYASVDDPNQGIKGTICRPLIVATMNNNIYDNVDHTYRAFYRRRRFVINMTKSEFFYPIVGNEENVDLSKYTVDEIADFKWAKFQIYAPVRQDPNLPIKELTYPELIVFIKEQYDLHMEIEDKLVDSLGEDSTTSKSPELIIDEVFRDVFELPKKNYSLVECAKEALKPVFSRATPIVAESSTEETAAEFARATTGNDSGILSRIPDYVCSRGGLMSIALLGACLVARKVFTGEEVSMPTFVPTAESDKPNKETRIKGSKRASRIHKASGKSNIVAESELVPSCQLTLVGKDFSTNMRGSLIKDRWILTIAHPLEVVSDKLKWVLSYGNETYEVAYNPDLILLDETTDFCLIYFNNKQLPQFKDRIRFFATDEEIDRFANAYVSMHYDGKDMVSPCRKLASLMMQIEKGDGTIESRVLDEAMEYHAETGYGMCGTTVKAITGPLVNKILGMHVAGNKDKTKSIQAHATFVTQEMLRTVITAAESNVYKVEEIPFNQVVNMPEKSKLSKTFLHGRLNEEERKQPAILSVNDKRSHGVDPVEKSIEVLDSCDGHTVKIDPIKLETVKKRLLHKYSKMEWPLGKRMLTFEEAVGGVPGILNSIKMKSSAGYPLCLSTTRGGKQDLCWFEDGILKYTPEFKKMVLLKVEEMLNFSGGEIDHRFLAYMKDELRKLSKIEKVSTRMIFANDVVFLVAGRMIYGALIAAFQHSYEVTGFAIGLNQYSEDMNRVYNRHKGRKIIDGDYEGYDQHYVEEVEEAGFWIFGQLALQIPGVTEGANQYFYQHETKSPVQIRNKLYYVVCSNKSGGIITTIINCIVNEEYVGLCWLELEPNLSIEENLICSFLGDDNLLSPTEAVSFKPSDLAKEMAKLGQVYTAADKTSSMDDWKEFGDCMFLGAIPRKRSNGVWTGALRKETLEETPKWTRDKGMSTVLTCQQMLDYASQWDEDYFNDYASRMKASFLEVGEPWTLNDSYHDLHNVVANRTCNSGKDFYRTIVAESKLGLTQISSDTFAAQFHNTEQADEQKLVSKSLGAAPVTLNYGTESYVRRATFVWSSTDVTGADVYGVDVPFGLLNLLDDHNLQNMPFEHTVFSNPDVELIFQVNGTPMQQGILVAYFQPLDLVNTPEIQNVTTLQHAFITPNQSVTTNLVIPYRHFASALRNRLGLGGEDYENLGRLHFGVLSPLKTITLPTTVDVTIYSRFKSEFYLPSAAAESLIVAEGGTQSTINYNLSDIAGNVPIQNTATTSNSTEVNASASIPLDNPPVAGGGLPVYNQFSSLAKIVGPEPTITLGEHPAMLCREPDSFREVDETLISNILGRRSYLKKVTMSTQATGDRFTDININSLFSDNGATMPWTIPAPIAVLNMALRWKGDIVFDIVAAKTHFHSFRLLASLGYGQTAVIAGTENSFITQVLDFNNETSWASVKMPYNNRYEYCRVFEGRPPLIQDVTEYGLGTLALTVANELRYANNVATSVEVLIFVRFENVQIVGMRPYNNIDWTGDGSMLPQIIAESELVPNLVPNNEGDAEDTDVTPVENTETIGSNVSRVPCRLDIGSKYEYTIRDVIEFGRRHTRISPWNYFNRPGYPHTGSTQQTENHAFEVYPVHWLNYLYAGWSGTLKYRIFYNYRSSLGSTNTHPTVVYIPSPSTNTTASNVNAEFFNADGTTGAIRATWDVASPFTHVARQGGMPCAGAEERLWQHTSTYAYIDISVPFYSEHNFLPTRVTFQKNNWSNGRIVVTVPSLSTAGKLEVYQAFGDDFRYHCWSPYSLLKYKPVLQTSGDAPPADATVGMHNFHA